MWSRLAFLAVAAVASAGCGNVFGSDEPVDLTPEPGPFLTGDVVELTVTNDSRLTIYLGVCPEALVAVGEPETVIPFEQACPDLLEQLEPGETLTMAGHLPPSAGPGRYRVQITYRVESPERPPRTVQSRIIAVTGPAPD